MPMAIGEFYGWLESPNYQFFWSFDEANNSDFNTANYVNPTIDTARFTADPAVYKASLQTMVDTVMIDLPRIPLYNRFAVYAMQKDIEGFECWSHTHPDFRTLYKD